MRKVCSGTGSLKKEDQQLRLAPSASRIILTRKTWTHQVALPSQGPWGRRFTLCGVLDVLDEVTELVQNHLECLLNADSWAWVIQGAPGILFYAQSYLGITSSSSGLATKTHDLFRLSEPLFHDIQKRRQYPLCGVAVRMKGHAHRCLTQGLDTAVLKKYLLNEQMSDAWIVKRTFNSRTLPAWNSCSGI